ncbi:hypothetical protein GEMRC1_003057 [Eukaryota sp. GEM-RC1]
MGKWTGTKSTSTKAEKERIQSSNPQEVADLLSRAKKVLIVPGYGLAVSRGQFACVAVAETLVQRGIKVSFVTHPVAGRMPGHMSVILGEAKVPWSQIEDVEDVNKVMETYDVAIAIGSNDIVNPAAIDDVDSPIYGMPIVEVHRAKTVVMIKRSLSFGYAKIDNPLWYKENCKMLFSDAKESMENILAALPKEKTTRTQAVEEEDSSAVVMKEEEEEKIPFGGVPQEKRVRVLVPREEDPETRVSLAPEHVEKLTDLGFEVYVESGAGDLAGFYDDQYLAAGGFIVGSFVEGVGAIDRVVEYRTPEEIS